LWRSEGRLCGLREDFSLLTFKSVLFEESGKMATADSTLIERAKAVPIKELARKANIDRNTIRKMLRGLPVRRATLKRVVRMLADPSLSFKLNGIPGDDHTARSSSANN
jgi:hypothetical protein